LPGVNASQLTVCPAQNFTGVHVEIWICPALTFCKVAVTNPGSCERCIVEQLPFYCCVDRLKPAVMPKLFTFTFYV
jgi:hypothetical protein